MKTLIKNIDTLEFSPYELAILEDLLAKGKEFQDNEAFKDKDYCMKLVSYAGPVVDTSWFFNHLNSMDGINSGEYSKNTTLSAEEEKILFLKYNYLKKKIDSLAKLNVPESYGQLLSLNKIADSVKEQLVGANLALVVSISQSNTFKTLDMTEALSEGHMALIIAVEKFDVSYGKFSTYLTKIMVRRMIKVHNTNVKNSVNTVEYDPSTHDRSEEDSSLDPELVELINRLVSSDGGVLNDDEKFVIQKKYMDGLTLEQIGQLYDPVKTKGQVFYVEKNARLKLKDALTEML